MKKILQLSIMVFALLLAFQVDVDAQYGGRKKKKKKKKPTTEKTDDYFDESGNIAAKLWYGGNIGNIGLGGNSFSAAVSPMVGYKITNNLSTGVIGKLDYFYQRYNPSLTLSNLDLSIGAFARFKIIPAIFLHAELETTSFQRPEFDNLGQVTVDQGKIVTNRESQPHFYVGGGYNSGNGLFGYEISFYYNVIDKATNYRTPFDLRIGFNYNF